MSKTSNFWKTGDQGAATMLVAAFDPALKGEPWTSRSLSSVVNLL